MVGGYSDGGATCQCLWCVGVLPAGPTPSVNTATLCCCPTCPAPQHLPCPLPPALLSFNITSRPLNNKGIHYQQLLGEILQDVVTQDTMRSEGRAASVVSLLTHTEQENSKTSVVRSSVLHDAPLLSCCCPALCPRPTQEGQKKKTRKRRSLSFVSDSLTS